MYQSNLVSFTTYSHSSVRLTSAYLPRAFPTEIMCLFLYSHASYIPPLQTPKFNYPNASTAPPPPRTWFSLFPPKKNGEGISLRHRFQTGSGAHPASYPMGTGVYFHGDNAAWTWNWPLISIYCRG